MIALRSRFFYLAIASLLLIAGCARSPKMVSNQQMFVQPPVTPSAASVQGGFYHTMTRGETIYRIAKKYSVDQKELMRVNRISDPSHLEVGQQIFIPQRQRPTFQRALSGPLSEDEVRWKVGAPRSRSVWRTITLHHSATKKGSAKAFHREHTRRRMGGLFYHFVIGNGTSTGDGALEVGFRWQKQVKANRPYDIQVCLVGDFNTQEVSESQFSTTATLVKMLMHDYGVPLSGVRKHEDIKGKHTACPGTNFPFDRLLSEVAGA